jgi:UDP-N-acetylmuramate dehydrogenase
MRDEPLARHSQYGVGGPADFYVAVRDEDALVELVTRCAANAVPLTVLGAGSNALILDGGIRGLAVRLLGKTVVVDGDCVALGAGAMMPRVALDLARRGLAGMEWGIGVPGSCGASVWGNAGAFDSDVAGTLLDCDVLAPDGRVSTLRAADCGFAYRHSRFKEDLAGHVVLRARFATSPRDVATVRARTDAVQAERKRTQPYGVRSLGSTFKNPPGDFAGRLIEAAGLKGRTHGGAQISPKHANFILNVDHASAADVRALVDLAREVVAERFDVVLEREIVVLGEAAPRAAAAASA